MRVLLVEDEEEIKKIVQMNLELEGFEVVSTGNGIKALEIIANQFFNVLILDIMLPGINGIEICEQVRLRNEQVGILFMSAKNTSQDRITGLKAGADDYLTKPFELEELLLRVHNLIKRTSEVTEMNFSEYSFGNNTVNFETYEAVGVNGPLKLTHKESLLLKLLIEKKNEVVSRQQILQYVWGYDVFPSTRTVDNFILSIRKHFEPNPKSPQYFHSIRGVGYKFTD